MGLIRIDSQNILNVLLIYLLDPVSLSEIFMSTCWGSELQSLNFDPLEFSRQHFWIIPYWTWQVFADCELVYSNTETAIFSLLCFISLRFSSESREKCCYRLSDCSQAPAQTSDITENERKIQNDFKISSNVKTFRELSISTLVNFVDKNWFENFWKC